jgi:hypothetical protein
MPDIVQEGRRKDQPLLISIQAKAMAQQSCKVHRAKGMLETGVVRPRVHKVGKTQLADVAQPLDGRGIEQVKGSIVNLDVAVDRVLDDLHSSG